MNPPHPQGGSPYGGMPMQQPPPPPARRHEMSYSPMPQHMRPQPPYQSYYHPHMSGQMPQYPTHFAAPQWYSYQHVHHQPPPPRMYPTYAQHQIHQPHPHGPMVAPPYPPLQPPHTPSNAPPIRRQHSSASPSHALFVPQSNGPLSTLVQPPFSPPPSTTPSTANPQLETPPSTSSGISAPASEVSFSQANEAFFPQLPWSVGDQPFPNKRRQPKRRIKRSELGTSPVNFPPDHAPVSAAAAHTKKLSEVVDIDPVLTGVVEKPTEERVQIEESIAQTPTTQISETASDTGSTDPTTPSPALTPQTPKAQPVATPQPRQPRAVLPVIPVIPILPFSPKAPKHSQRESTSIQSTASQPPKVDQRPEPPMAAPTTVSTISNDRPSQQPEVLQPASPPPPPKSWAELVRSNAPPKPQKSVGPTSQVVNGLGPAKSETLSDVLNTINVTATHSTAKIAFLKPRGLVNTGNMCYMNSVLQILVFCIPFYEFLERVGQRSTHTFKSETPLIDAMILFMREFAVIDSAESFEQLRLRLKPDELEQYGDSFIPEYVYQIIRQLPRFRDMRRGHQQDAQEFLGFLLEELHEECAQAMRNGDAVNSETATPTEQSSNVGDGTDNDAGWMEVGHKQRPAITRSSGTVTTISPITKIFGGKLRSEWKVPGNKNSVTLEPYQPLQLDIGSPQFNNIIDALKGVTRPESLQGDFNSSRGSRVTATKQVFIDTLPPVLILHLKRFQYDASTKRTEKIWKKVGYPLELEMPKEVFPTQIRNKFALHGGLPRYQLTGVIYHHGKNASGGHYTVDVRRQDGKEWIRLDDTVIRRVRSEDVAECGSEEDPKILAAALERHKQQSRSGGRGNIFEQFEKNGDDGDAVDENVNAWSQINGHSRNKHSTATATAPNGTSTPTSNKSSPQTPRDRFAGRDNKVAYLLFYRRVSS